MSRFITRQLSPTQNANCGRGVARLQFPHPAGLDIHSTTIRPIVAKIPVVMKPGAYEVYAFRVEDNGNAGREVGVADDQPPAAANFDDQP